MSQENMSQESMKQESEQKKGKEKRTIDENLELIIVIMLGVTALLMAWAGWLGSLHAGNQTDNYIMSSHLAAEGNSEYNMSVQMLMQDMMLYNEINSMEIDLVFAEEHGNTLEQERLEWKLDELMANNMSDELYEAYVWAREIEVSTGEVVSPFEKEGFIESYFEAADELLAESEEIMLQGQEDGNNSSAFGLVAVLYSVSLFLLGIAGTFKVRTKRIAVTAIAGVTFLMGTIYMLTLPLPDGFNLGNFFGA